MSSELKHKIVIKFPELSFLKFDVNVFETVLSIPRYFNLVEYREVIVKKFTVHYTCRNAELNLILVAARTKGLYF